MSDNINEVKNIVEAALLSADQPLSVRKLATLFPDDAQPEREALQAAIDELVGETRNRGVELRKIAGGYRYQSKEKYAPWLQKLNSSRPPRYSRALLETLAIIAYRQPVTRGDIEDIRGVSVSSETMRILLNREWVHAVGQRDVPGRPTLYGTTRQFLEYFNLKSLSELPELSQIRDVESVARDNDIQLPEDLFKLMQPQNSSDDKEPAAGNAAAEQSPQQEVLPLRRDMDVEASGPGDGDAEPEALAAVAGISEGS